MSDLRYDISLGIQQALQSLDKFTEKIRKVSNDLDAVTSKMSGFAAAGTAALTGLAASAAAFADELADVAAANETTIASVLGLGSALQSAGGNADSVGRLLQSLSNNMESANSGNLKMVSTFEKLGISISDLGALSQDQIRNRMIKALAEMTDVTERNALAQQMFGKAALGVDWKAVAADIDSTTAKYRDYEDSLKTAGEAFDAMAAIMKDIKIAAAEAFEPLFKYISKLKVDIPTVTTLIKIFAAALAVAVSASVLAGFAKLLVILKDIGTVVSKNKLVTIVGTLLSVGVGVAAWAGLMKDVEEETAAVADSQQEVSDKADKTKRDQTGIYEAIKKQKDALSQVTEQYDRQIKNIKDKIDFEGEALLLTEEQKKLKQEQNAIEQASLNALASLKQKYDGMDIDARKRVQSEYEKEKAAIIATGDAAKKSVADRISETEQLKNKIRDLSAVINQGGAMQIQTFETWAKFLGDKSGIEQRIELEARLAEIQQTRQLLIQSTASLSENERSSAVAQINNITTQIKLLEGTYGDLNDRIKESLALQLKSGEISQQSYDAMVQALQQSGNVFGSAAEIMAENNKNIVKYQSTFSYGWEKAFREYSSNAMNAATQAERIFNRITSSMEDMLMGFFKTGKLGWKEFLNSVIEQLMRSQIQQLIAKTFGGVGAISGSSKGGLLGGSIIPGFLAQGGPAQAGSPYVVGENGPEMFVPGTSGTVIPNNQLPGSGSITYNINAVDAMSFKQMIAADPSFLYAVTEQGRRRMPGAR